MSRGPDGPNCPACAWPDDTHGACAHHEAPPPLGGTFWAEAMSLAAGQAYERGRVAGLAEALGIAHVRKVGAPVVVGRRGKPVEWAGVGPVDYLGTLRGGRALAVEAKSVDGRLSRADIAEHQREHLDAVAALGGLALLAVEVRGVGLFVCPWTAVPWRESSRNVAPRKGAAKRTVQSRTVGAEELAPWRVRGECYVAAFAAGGAK